MKTKPLIVLLAVVVFGLTLILTSSPAFAQSQRGAIVVINDWDESVDLTVLMERHDEMITKHWEIAPRVRTYLLDESGERKVRASARDRIKIKSYARPVAIGDVGRFRDGEWLVRVRTIYEAQGGRGGHRR
jgi:sulfur relay (sulfurtransferase) DsrC/TusE family protein